MKRLIRWFLFVVQALFVCVLVAAGVGCYGAYLLFVPVGGGTRHTYDLPPGSNAATVASDLEGQNLIRSATAFRVLLRVTGTAPRLQAGRHVLLATMTSWQILGELQKPTEVAGVRVTVPEGKTLRQVAAIVQQRAGIPNEDFLAVAGNPRDVFPARTWLPAEGMEGYLFPDTFNVSKTAQAREVVDMMLVRFEKEVLPVVRGTPAPRGLDLQQVVTMASLVEAEAQVATERPRIAAVYYNRLKIDMPLQCDATVLYALKQRKTTVTLRRPAGRLALQHLPQQGVASRAHLQSGHRIREGDHGTGEERPPVLRPQ